ncbi:unnamed protein product [Adineta steineri]|uniref:G-protein coupled receptors family 1 profile domain-containing protein n=1 Tax=Adineta steineri TaxID=433720 RepID=A0A813MQF4_9BILA|nr:unnamed protein product [Adineta steineri]CAF3720831.1 unnamed protein product [Adineta steineri]
MFKIKRKSQVPSLSSVNRTTTLFTFSSFSSSSSTPTTTPYHRNNGSSSFSSLCNNITKDQSSKFDKTRRQQQQQRNEQIINNTRSPRSKQFLAYFRCCCYHLCSFTCECSIPSNTNQNRYASSIFTRQIRSSSSSINSSYYRHHLRHYLFERHFIEIKTKQIFPSKFTLWILLLPFLFPITFATKTPSPSKTNHDLFLLNDYTLKFSFNLSLQRPSWHAGCCIRYNQTMCNTTSYSSISSHSIYVSNDTSHGSYLFDGGSNPIDRRRLFHLNELTDSYDFLNNQTLFCQRYDEFRKISGYELAIVTYVIVVIGIIFNSCVFIVLMCGSLRRSSSFTLFLALTCFDLLSLASSLFALLFRNVMTYLKTSAPFCKMFGIFFLYFRQCSSTTLLIIAIERCVVIKYPLCRYMFNKFRLPFLAFMMLIYIVPIPFDFIFYTSGTLHCEAFDTLHAHRYQIFRGFFTVFSYAMIPFFGISISNLLIIIELKNSRKRFKIKDEDGTTKNLSSTLMDKRGTTVMLFVASFAFLLLLGPFYLHWCITYLFRNYPQCHFTRNLYENIQVCMGVFHPYLTIIEKCMRESNHAINFLLYMATSKRFRSDFKTICRRFIYRICGPAILFLYRRICCCCPVPTCLVTLERRMSDIKEQDLILDVNRKNHTAYKTSHYHSNFERRRQQQLLRATLLNNTNTTAISITPAASFTASPVPTAKTVRTLTWNVHDPLLRCVENKRQAARLSRHFSTSDLM